MLRACFIVFLTWRCSSDFIARGGIGGVPTETVYGLAADATNPDAVRKIFAAKGRPFIDPLIVHVCDMRMAREIAVFTPDAEKLAEEVAAFEKIRKDQDLTSLGDLLDEATK